MTNNIYALWYTTTKYEKSANAISLNKDSLLKLHETSILNRECLYHKYKSSILKIDVEQITCYTYNKKNKKLEIYNENDKDIIENGSFYAVSYFPFYSYLNGMEVLVYLSKNDHKIWRTLCKSEKDSFTIDSEYPKFFYDETISYDPVIPDTYYEEGIMNA